MYLLLGILNFGLACFPPYNVFTACQVAIGVYMLKCAYNSRKETSEGNEDKRKGT